MAKNYGGAGGGAAAHARSAGMSLRRNPNFGRSGHTARYRYNIRGQRNNMWARNAREAHALISDSRRARG